MALHQSIQRGSVTLSTGGAVTNVTISTVTMARAFVYCTVRSPSADPSGYQLYYNLTSTTNIEMRVNVMTTASVVVEWQVIEFTVASGITVQRGTYATTGAGNVTLSALSSVTQASVFLCMHMTGANLGADDEFRAKITSTTNLQTNSGSTSTKVYQVVDWGTHATVQHVDISVLAGDTTTKNVTISALTNYLKTVVVGTSQVVANFFGSSIGNMRCTSNTNLEFKRGGGTTAYTVNAQVIEFKASNITVQQFVKSMPSASSSVTQTITAVNTSNTIIIPGSALAGWAGATTGTDDAGFFSFTYNLTNSTTVTLQRSDTGADAEAFFSVLDFSDVGSAGSMYAVGSISITGTAKPKLQAISTFGITGTANLTALPVVTNVSSDKTNATYGVGEDIYISVEFNVPVATTGTPQLNLAVKSGGYLVNRVAMKTPLDIVSLAGWWDFSDKTTITSVNNFVSQVNDKSTNSRHLVQAVESKKPTTNIRTIGGLNTLDFDSTSADMMATSNAWTHMNASAYSIFAVLQFDAHSCYFVGTNQPANTAGLHTGYRNSTQYTLDHYNAGIDITLTPNLTTPMLINTQFNNIGCNIYQNGVSIGSSTGFPSAALATTTGVLNVGSGFANDSVTFNGAIGELCIFVGAMTQANREAIEGILAHKWGLTANLDNAHPYKNRPPLVS